MPRYKVTIEYDGTGMAGWQRQKNPNTIQQKIEEAIFKFCGKILVVHGCGRTDAGVHAYNIVAHFDLDKDYPCNVVINAINYHLRPNKIAITSAQIVDEQFHARFSAISRCYKYLVINRESPLILQHNRAWHLKCYINLDLMREAAKYLIGHHDFTSFRAKFCQAKSPIRTLNEITITKENDHIEFFVRAPSFLHHMVRNIVGTLVMVGNGKLNVEDVAKILSLKDRNHAGVTAPSCGLYFISADYKGD